MLREKIALGAAMALTLGQVALAQVPAESAKGGEDPNEVVCEKITVTGSRLGTKRVCATRAQWAERRALDKDTIERAQRVVNGPCQTVGTHSGAAGC